MKKKSSGRKDIQIVHNTSRTEFSYCNETFAGVPLLRYQYQTCYRNSRSNRRCLET